MNTPEKIKKQKSSIQNSSDAELLDLLVELRESSAPEIIPDAIERWFKTEDPSIKSALYSFLIDLKNQDCVQYILTAIQDERYRPKVNELVSILWQSSLDASSYIDELVDTALTGDYLTIIEISTVIENFDNSFDEDHVLELNYNIQEAVYDDSDEHRVNILQSLGDIISNLPLQ